jgi:DNA-binding NtrC family response regulator
VDESHHRVLIVDDERTIAETLALVFSSGGYETQTAYTAEQAVEIVADWLPHLAIIDVVLPQTNGIDLVILLTAQCPACRILIFSGEAVTDDLLLEAAKKGYKFEILAKPTHPTVMLDTALNLLAANQSKQSSGGHTASEELRLAEAEQPPMA